MVGVLEELFEDRWDFSSRWMSEAFASIEVLMVVLCAVSANEKECLWYFWSQARCKEKWLKEFGEIKELFEDGSDESRTTITSINKGLR